MDGLAIVNNLVGSKIELGQENLEDANAGNGPDLSGARRCN